MLPRNFEPAGRRSSETLFTPRFDVTNRENWSNGTPRATGISRRRRASSIWGIRRGASLETGRSPVVLPCGPDKRRPVLVLTGTSALSFLHSVSVAPVTTRIRNIPTEVVLTEEDGMPEPFAINLDNIQTVPRERLGNLLILVPVGEVAGDAGSS